MPDQHDSRRKLVFALVLGLIVVGLGTMLLIGILSGDDTDETVQQPEEANDSARIVGDLPAFAPVA